MKVSVPLLVVAILAAGFGYSQENDCGRVSDLQYDLPDHRSFKELINFHIEAKDYQKAFYYLEQDKLYFPSEEPQERAEREALIRKNLTSSKDCGCELPNKLEWRSSNGPEGADATAFFVDSDGSYWLGTGSSGGMFHSINKGKSWQMENKGIGPWHVVNIDRINDTLFIKVDHHYGYNEQVYYWKTSENLWVYYPGKYYSYDEEWEGPGGAIMKKFSESEKTFDEARTSSDMNLTAYFDSKYKYEVDGYIAKRSEELNNYNYAQEVSTEARVFGFKETSEEIAKLNNSFPRDVFHLSAGNKVDIGKGSSIILAKSGPYLCKKNKSIKPMSTSGMVATDVRFLTSKNDGSIYGLVNDADIWKLSGGSWSCVFNAYEHHLEMENPISKSGYNTSNLNLQKDGTVFFTFCGELWKLDPQDNASKVLFDYSTIYTQTSETRFIVRSGGYGKDGTLYVSADILEFDGSLSKSFRQDDSDDYESGKSTNFVLNVKNGSAEVVRTSVDFPGSKLINDGDGRLWLLTLNSMISMDGLCEDLELNYRYNDDAVAHTIGPNGEFAVMRSGNIYEWDKSNSEWKYLDIEPVEFASCVAYDKNGKLFVGTGQRYQTGCGGGPFDEHAMGVYQLKEGRFVPIIGGPNTWIYSLTYHPDGLAVGTSGSGLQVLNTK